MTLKRPISHCCNVAKLQSCSVALLHCALLEFSCWMIRLVLFVCITACRNRFKYTATKFRRMLGMFTEAETGFKRTTCYDQINRVEVFVHDTEQSIYGNAIKNIDT